MFSRILNINNTLYPAGIKLSQYVNTQTHENFVYDK